MIGVNEKIAIPFPRVAIVSDNSPYRQDFYAAEDLAKLTKYAMKNEEFMRIFGTKELKWEGTAWNTTLFSHHKLMREQPYEGLQVIKRVLLSNLDLL